VVVCSRSSSGARWRPSFEQNDYSVAARDNSGLKGLQLAVGESSGRHRGRSLDRTIIQLPEWRVAWVVHNWKRMGRRDL
jgi:hypothetical protein